MIEQVTVNACTCDGCGRVLLGSNDVEDLPGYYGNIHSVDEHSNAGNTALWFACRQRCIGKAAYSAVVRADAPGGQGELAP